MNFTKKCIRNDFYSENPLRMLFIAKMQLEMIFSIKCIRNDFYYKNVWEMIFIIKIP